MDLTDDAIRGLASLKFNDKYCLAVFADGQYVNGPRIGRILLSYRLALVAEDIVFLAKVGILPIRNKELFEILLHRKDTRVLDVRIIRHDSNRRVRAD